MDEEKLETPIEETSENETISTEEAKTIIGSVGKRPKTDNSTGDVLFEMYDSMERFTTERIILISRRIQLDESVLIDILKANSELASRTRRRIGDGRPNRFAKLGESLMESGLL